ncbi:MAG: hypothetical protein ABWK05_07680 [Pyrobaculum sp.]
MVLPAYFKLEPKERLEELYDFEEELLRLKSGYETARVVAVLGLRRTGKSSLVRTFLNAYQIPHIYVDLRRAVAEQGRATKRGVWRELGRALSAFLEGSRGLGRRLMRRLAKIKGVSLSVEPLSVSLEWSREAPALTDPLMERAPNSSRRPEAYGAPGRRIGARAFRDLGGTPRLGLARLPATPRQGLPDRVLPQVV